MEPSIEERIRIITHEDSCDIDSSTRRTLSQAQKTIRKISKVEREGNTPSKHLKTTFASQAPEFLFWTRLQQQQLPLLQRDPEVLSSLVNTFEMIKEDNNPLRLALNTYIAGVSALDGIRLKRDENITAKPNEISLTEDLLLTSSSLGMIHNLGQLYRRSQSALGDLAFYKHHLEEGEKDRIILLDKARCWYIGALQMLKSGHQVGNMRKPASMRAKIQRISLQF